MDTTSAPSTLRQVLEDEYAAIRGRRPGAAATEMASLSEQARLKMFFETVHREEPLTALCLSGGGIRSATFGLGVLQAFARHGVLQGIEYLSTVSGGGYIGSWLSAWIRRDGRDSVLAQLARCGDERPMPEPSPVHRLRAYSSYLSPHRGLTSVDFWTIVVTWVRNVVLNWLLLIPLIAALVLVPQTYLYLAQIGQAPTLVPGAVIVATLAGIFGILYAAQDLPSGGGRAWPLWRFKRFCLGPLALTALALPLAWAWYGGAHGSPIGWDRFAAAGGLLYAATAMIGSRAAGLRTRLLSGAAALAAGVVAGTVLYLIARRWFPLVDASGGYVPVDARFAVLAPPAFVLALLVAPTLYVGLSSEVTGEADGEWWSRAGAWLAIVASTWLVIAGVVLLGPWTIPWVASWQITGAIGGGTAAGALTALRAYSSRLGLGEFAGARNKLRELVERYALNIGALVFLLLLVVGVAMGVEVGVDALKRSTGIEAWQAAGAALVVALAFAWSMSWFIGINRFSLHSMYGNRLVRAYLGASRVRNPYPVIGFDPGDNLMMHELRGQRPFHVVNVALNIVGGGSLAWQDRKAKSFTMSPLHCGTWATDPGDGVPSAEERTRAAGVYRDSARYGGENGTSLGKALAISGAAASPSMGYHSSPLPALVMTFFNARLGWWLGNPGPEGARTWTKSEPRLALRPLVEEAFGLATDRSPYVYLSDGGHFENLGLYEMVLRRCRRIIVVDAGCDPAAQYEDLSGAIRKIRSDLGIPIELTRMPDDTTPWGEGTIHYDAVDGDVEPGVLVYLKPRVLPDAPRDVRHYAATHADPGNAFPQQTTADQFFDEAQFESYRALGFDIASRACGPLIDPPARAESAGS